MDEINLIFPFFIGNEQLMHIQLCTVHVCMYLSMCIWMYVCKTVCMYVPIEHVLCCGHTRV